MSTHSEEELQGFLTAYDNTQEPKTAFNRPDFVYGLVISFSVLSWICVLLRLYVRFKRKCFRWDDFFVILFRISGTIGSTFIVLLVPVGLGEHFRSIGQANMVLFQQRYYAALATYMASTTLMKLSLLSQYLRIFQPGTQIRKICWIGLVVSAFWGSAFSLIALAPCFPIQGFWDWSTPSVCYGFGSKKGAELAGTYAGHGASNVLLDLLVLAIPLPLYFRKAATFRERRGIGALLFLGILVNLISIWRLASIVEHKAATYPVLDPTWYGPISIVLAAVEVDLASVCASIPIFWPMVTQDIFGKIFVRQEVHITHQHRRLSGDEEDQPLGLNLQISAGGRRSSSFRQQRSRGGKSEISLELVRMPTDRDDKGFEAMTSAMTIKKKPPSRDPSSERQRHYQDRYVMSSVIPLGVGDPDTNHLETGNDPQISSDGSRGFHREKRERERARKRERIQSRTRGRLQSVTRESSDGGGRDIAGTTPGSDGPGHINLSRTSSLRLLK